MLLSRQWLKKCISRGDGWSAQSNILLRAQLAIASTVSSIVQTMGKNLYSERR
jgi:hypothetical protein